MKVLLQNLWLVLGSTALALAIGELVLRMDGRFTYLTSQTYVRSPAIWERPSNKTETHRQPDLNRPVEIRFDADGVRNHTRVPTSEKRNVIGVFGDSFVENRRIEDRFSFTTVLDEAAQLGVRVVNFGVDGYGLDQEYLRYKKFESQDIRHVVYVFCGNDLSNLFETGLAQRDENGGVTFRPPGPRLMYHALGRLHLTYLILSGYQDLVRHIRRADRDQDQVASDFLSPRPSAEIQTVARTFLLVLEKWRSEVEMRGRTFTVLVLPRRIDTDIASQLLRGFNGRVAYMEAGFEGCRGCFFRTDAHWNEYGNLRAATVIQQDTGLPFHQAFDGIDVEPLMKQIDAYYQER